MLSKTSPVSLPVAQYRGLGLRHVTPLLKGALMVSAVISLSACATGGSKGGGLPNDIPSVSDAAPIVSGTMRPYTIRGRTYRPQEQPDYDEVGMASWYGQYHHGKSTSTGERFDMNALTAAHKTLPLPSMVEVTNPANGRRVLLRVNDRGPFVDSRIIDLSRGAAEELGLLQRGVGEVRVRYAGPAPRSGGGMRLVDVGGRSSAPQTRTAQVQSSPAPSSSTERSYSEVVGERRSNAPAVQRTSQTTSASRNTSAGNSTPYVRTRRDVPIPQQPLPPLMPTRDPVAPVATVAPPPPPAYVPPAPVVGNYRVQVISFEDRAFADAVARRVGSDAVVESFERNGRSLYRVVVGSGTDRDGAERLRQAVIARGFADALLIGD